MKKLILIGIAFLFFVNLAFATVKTDIEKANKAGNCVFLVVTEAGNPDNAAAINLCKEAQKLTPKSCVIELNRSEKTNESLVTKYRLAGANLPLVLVIASNGVESGGIPYSKQTTVENIIALIPSPKKADVLKIVNEGKPVFLVVSKKSIEKKEVLKNCKAACKEISKGAKIVEVDFDDVAEKVFLNSIKITGLGSEPQTYVINTKGQIEGSFTGITDSNTLVEMATRKAGGGCCPPGSKKTCPPTKK